MSPAVNSVDFSFGASYCLNQKRSSELKKLFLGIKVMIYDSHYYILGNHLAVHLLPLEEIVEVNLNCIQEKVLTS